MLPHILFHHLFTHSLDVFCKLFLGTATLEDGQNRCERFWREVVRRRDPRLRHHPLTSAPNWVRRFVPMALHGDGVGCIRVNRTGSESLDVLSFMSIFGKGSTLELKLYIVSLFEWCRASSTDAEIWKVVIWSLKSLQCRKLLDSDWTGTKYARLTSEAEIANTGLAGLSFPYSAN